MSGITLEYDLTFLDRTWSEFRPRPQMRLLDWAQQREVGVITRHVADVVAVLRVGPIPICEATASRRRDGRREHGAALGVDRDALGEPLLEEGHQPFLAIARSTARPAASPACCAVRASVFAANDWLIETEIERCLAASEAGVEAGGAPTRPPTS